MITEFINPRPRRRSEGLLSPLSEHCSYQKSRWKHNSTCLKPYRCQSQLEILLISAKGFGMLSAPITNYPQWPQLAIGTNWKVWLCDVYPARLLRESGVTAPSLELKTTPPRKLTLFFKEFYINRRGQSELREDISSDYCKFSTCVGDIVSSSPT